MWKKWELPQVSQLAAPILQEQVSELACPTEEGASWHQHWHAVWSPDKILSTHKRPELRPNVESGWRPVVGLVCSH